MMEYKGYIASVEFDSDAMLLHGQVANIRDVVTFQGTSVDELQREFEASVDDYLAFCAERGESPEKPFSGKLMLRITPDLHRSVALAAAAARSSINKWITATLTEATNVTTTQRAETTAYSRFFENTTSIPVLLASFATKEREYLDFAAVSSYAYSVPKAFRPVVLSGGRKRKRDTEIIPEGVTNVR